VGDIVEGDIAEGDILEEGIVEEDNHLVEEDIGVGVAWY
jgi:hypothetical protein